MFGLFKKAPSPHSPEDNAASIDAIPATHISEYDRALYRQRALVGEDVYAYHSGPGEGVWNLWDTETRIAQPLHEKRWHLDIANFVGDSKWQVIASRNDETRDVCMYIGQHVGEDDARYFDRARRVCLEVVNHCAQFDIDPAQMEGTQH